MSLMNPYIPPVDTGWLDWAPFLAGATSAPTSTNYTKQLGRYRQQGQTITFRFQIIIASFLKLTGLSDQVRISGLPVKAVASPDIITPCVIQMQNGGLTGGNANAGQIPPDTQYINLLQQSLTGALTGLTYTLLGTLSNQMIFSGYGEYECQ